MTEVHPEIPGHIHEVGDPVLVDALIVEELVGRIPVVRHIEVEQPVAVVVEERRAGREDLAPDARLAGHRAEDPRAVVEQQGVGPLTGQEKVRVAVLVDVAARDSHGGTLIAGDFHGHAPGGDVGEGTAVVAEQAQVPTHADVEEVEIEVAVAIEPPGAGSLIGGAGLGKGNRGRAGAEQCADRQGRKDMHEGAGEPRAPAEWPHVAPAFSLAAEGYLSKRINNSPTTAIYQKFQEKWVLTNRLPYREHAMA